MTNSSGERDVQTRSAESGLSGPRESVTGSGRRVLVCGGRDYGDNEFLFSELDRLHALDPFYVVIQGGASGADYLAMVWAQGRGVPVLEFPANWRAYGRSAGPLRNAQMIAEGNPDFVIAFAGGAGTRDMIRQAHAAEITVYNTVTELAVSHRGSTP